MSDSSPPQDKPSSTSEASSSGGNHLPVKTPEPITDSPWFWAYVFATAGLIALALAAPKYYSRQTQLERRFLARQEGGQTVKGAGGKTIDTPTEENLILNLGPLFIICGLLLVVAWGRFWWTRTGPGFEKKVSHSSDNTGDIPNEMTGRGQ